MSNTPPVDTHDYRLALALRGFDEARDRFRRVSADVDFYTDPHAVHLPLVETLWWAVSADEELETRAPDKNTYRKARDADPDGRFLAGMRFARNHCGHQRALAPKDHSFRLDISNLDDPEYVLGPAIKWRPLHELPTPKGRPDPAGEQNYDQHLSGQMIIDTLPFVESWFQKAQQIWP